MTLSSSSLSIHSTLTQAFLTFITLFSFLVTANRLTLLLTGLKNQLGKIHNSSLDTSHSARNLVVIFDEHLTLSDQITSLSKACYYHIRHLRCIRFYLDSSTACTIANLITVILSKLFKSQLSRLQQIQNSLVRTVVKARKSCHITCVICSLHWLRITECVEYKILSLTYKVLTTTQPPSLPS